MQAYDPVDVRTGEPLGENQVVLSPLVTRALISLTTSVNPLDSSEIRTWALAHGWQAQHAADLAELAAKIAGGKRVKGTAMTKTEAKQIIARLQAAIDSEPGY